MQVTVAGACPLENAPGDEMDRAETVTLFNDMCLLAPGIFIDPNIAWEAVDATTARARFRNGRHTIAATLLFNGAGELKLVQIKLLHTAKWSCFVVCSVAIPIAGGQGYYFWAAVLIGLVLVECGVLAANRGRCPLTDMAATHTEQRAANFDIYLPAPPKPA